MTRCAKTPRHLGAPPIPPLDFRVGLADETDSRGRTLLAPGFRHASVPPCLRLSEGVLRMAMRVLGGNDGFRPLFVSPTAPQEPPPRPTCLRGPFPGTRRISPRDTPYPDPKHGAIRGRGEVGDPARWARSRIVVDRRGRKGYTRGESGLRRWPCHAEAVR